MRSELNDTIYICVHCHWLTHTYGVLELIWNLLHQRFKSRIDTHATTINNLKPTICPTESIAVVLILAPIVNNIDLFLLAMFWLDLFKFGRYKGRIVSFREPLFKLSRLSLCLPTVIKWQKDRAWWNRGRPRIALISKSESCKGMIMSKINDQPRYLVRFIVHFLATLFFQWFRVVSCSSRRRRPPLTHVSAGTSSHMKMNAERFICWNKIRTTCRYIIWGDCIIRVWFRFSKHLFPDSRSPFRLPPLLTAGLPLMRSWRPLNPSFITKLNMLTYNGVFLFYFASFFLACCFHQLLPFPVLTPPNRRRDLSLLS